MSTTEDIAKLFFVTIRDDTWQIYLIAYDLPPEDHTYDWSLVAQRMVGIRCHLKGTSMNTIIRYAQTLRQLIREHENLLFHDAERARLLADVRPVAYPVRVPAGRRAARARKEIPAARLILRNVGGATASLMWHGFSKEASDHATIKYAGGHYDLDMNPSRTNVAQYLDLLEKARKLLSKPDLAVGDSVHRRLSDFPGEDIVMRDTAKRDAEKKASKDKKKEKKSKKKEKKHTKKSEKPAKKPKSHKPKRDKSPKRAPSPQHTVAKGVLDHARAQVYLDRVSNSPLTQNADIVREAARIGITGSTVNIYDVVNSQRGYNTFYYSADKTSNERIGLYEMAATLRNHRQLIFPDELFADLELWKHVFSRDDMDIRSLFLLALYTHLFNKLEAEASEDQSETAAYKASLNPNRFPDLAGINLYDIQDNDEVAAGDDIITFEFNATGHAFLALLCKALDPLIPASTGNRHYALVSMLRGDLCPQRYQTVLNAYFVAGGVQIGIQAIDNFHSVFVDAVRTAVTGEQMTLASNTESEMFDFVSIERWYSEVGLPDPAIEVTNREDEYSQEQMDVDAAKPPVVRLMAKISLHEL